MKQENGKWTPGYPCYFFPAPTSLCLCHCFSLSLSLSLSLTSLRNLSLLSSRPIHQSSDTMNIFSKKPKAKEVLRESKREMTNATRGIEKEISALQLEEKKLVAEIKRTAKTGNEQATKILARQLVRLRQQIANLQGSRAQIRGIATHTQATYAQSSVAGGIKGATKAMTAMNKQMDPAKQAKLLREFQKQTAQMDMTTEMMSEAIDDALDNDEAEEETDDLTSQVLDEIGVDVAAQLSSAPKGRIAAGTKRTENVSSSNVDELEKRLDALRNP